jgi:outer membrane lipoprotein SlyB
MAKKTYAAQAKSIMNRYKLRLGDKFDKSDPLALAAMNQELEGLQQEQEAVRAIELPTSQFANGGILPLYLNGGTFAERFNANKGIQGITGDQIGFTPDMMPATSAEAMAAQTGSQPASVGDDPFKSRVPWMGAAAGAIGGIIANRKIDLPSYDYEEYKPERARANLVDYSRGREQTLRERDQAQALITRSARGTGSQAGLMENILAGATGTQRAAGEAFNLSLEGEANVNAQIRNQTSQFNAAQQAQAAQMNARNRLYGTQLDRENVLIDDQRRQNRIGAITGAAQGYTRDRQAASQYDQMVNLEIGANPNFGLRQSAPNFWRKAAGFTDPIEELSYRNTNDYVNRK